MSWRRSGIMNSTPSHPPINARKKTPQYSSGNPRKISAGRVKITPPAMDSPAEPVVWTILFSRMLTLPKARRMLIESTAMGIDAETVSPARSPTYTVTAPKKSPATIPARMARKVNSATPFSESMYGLNSSGGAVELHVFVAKRHLSQACRERSMGHGERKARPKKRLPRTLSQQAPHHSCGKNACPCHSEATKRKAILFALGCCSSPDVVEAIAAGHGHGHAEELLQPLLGEHLGLGAVGENPPFPHHHHAIDF